MNFLRHKDYHVIHRPLKFKSINVSLYSVFSKAFNRFLGVLSLGRIVFSFLSVLKAIRFTKARFCPATLSSVLFLSLPNVTSRLQCILSTPQWFLAAVAKSMTLFTLAISVSYTHLRAHETRHDLVCRLLLEKKK